METKNNFEQWVETYRPAMNDNGEIITYETYGEDLAFVMSQPIENVWTFTDESGESSIVAGVHYVNRLFYYVTANTWTSPDEVIDLETTPDHDDESENSAPLFTVCDVCGESNIEIIDDMAAFVCDACQELNLHTRIVTYLSGLDEYHPDGIAARVVDIVADVLADNGLAVIDNDGEIIELGDI